MDRDAHAREVIVRLRDDEKTEVKRALERGGLPSVGSRSTLTTC
jgi:hypothetical protein